MSVNHAKLRLALLGVSISMALLCGLSFWMRRYYDRASMLSAMALCAAYAVFRSVNGRYRRNCREAWKRYAGTAMAASPHIMPGVRAAAAWGLLDAMWLSAGACACLTCGIPGVFAILFHGLFFAGFSLAPEMRRDLYDTEEKTQAMDVLEGILYTQACAAMALACLLFIK